MRPRLVAAGAAALFAAGAAVVALTDESNEDRQRRVGCSPPTGERVELTFAAHPRLVQALNGRALDATVFALCQRARAMEMDLAVERDGELIVVEAEDADSPVTQTGELRLYDWEPNVVGRDGRPGSGDPNPTGRLQSLYRAVKRAAKARPASEPSDRPSDRGNDSEPARWYTFDRDHELVGGPDTERPPAPGARSGLEIIKVPRGIVVIEEERPTLAGPATPRFYFVLEDDVELTGDDIRNPDQDFDPNTQEPIVTMDFTPRGRASFARVTKRLAARGAAQKLPPGVEPQSAFQRFAITLDDQIVTLAVIDFVENPTGIDGRTGAQINGVGSLQDTQQLATILRLGALPVDLELLKQRELE